MILEDILCDIKNSLEGTGYFSTVYEFAEMTKTKVEGGYHLYPRQYVGNGQYVNLFDLEENTGYIRKYGEVSFDELEDRTQSCSSNVIKLNYPMRFVFAVRKK